MLQKFRSVQARKKETCHFQLQRKKNSSCNVKKDKQRTLAELLLLYKAASTVILSMYKAFLKHIFEKPSFNEKFKESFR